MGTIRKVIEVDADISRVYEFLLDFRNYPRFMRFVEAVDEVEPGLTRWEARWPGRQRWTWQAALTDHVPGRVIAWKVVEGKVGMAGSVQLEAAGDKTLLTYVLSFKPPMGRIGAVLADVLRFPESQVQEDLLSLRGMLSGESG